MYYDALQIQEAETDHADTLVCKELTDIDLCALLQSQSQSYRFNSYYTNVSILARPFSHAGLTNIHTIS